MQRSGLIIVMGFLLIGLPGWASEFNQDGNREGWLSGNNIKSLEVKNGSLVVTIAANTGDPFINAPGGPFDGDHVTGIEMRMRWSYDVTGLSGPAVYFFPDGTSHAAASYTIEYPEEWVTVYIDFLSSDSIDGTGIWAGVINAYRIDFVNNVPEEYTIEIDWVRFIDDRVYNNNFDWETLDPWQHIGEGSMNDFAVKDNDWQSAYYSVDVTGLGSSRYHGLSQEVYDGLNIEKGSSVAVVASVYIPADSWDANSELWFRINESDGTTENLSPPFPVTVFGEWFGMESRVTLMYEPAERQSLTVQLYSKNPSGKVFRFDDVFVDVQAPEATESYWSWPEANWEFNTDGDTLGWEIGNGITSLDAVNGSLIVSIAADTNDPYLESPRGPFNADSMKGIAARMRISSGAELAGYNNYWFPTTGGHASQGYTIPGNGEWFVISQDLSTTWDGWFNYIRYDFGDFSPEDYTVEIDWIRFIDEAVDNNSFEGQVGPWAHEGAGSAADFTLSSDPAHSGETALEIKGLGSDRYHAVAQNIEKGMEIPAGSTVVLKGYYYIPSGSWDADSILWPRIQEWNGKVENHNDHLNPTVFNAWVPFEYSIQLQFEPEERIQMAIQLYSKTPQGTSIYLDDVYATVTAQAPASGWPVNAIKLAAGQNIVIDGTVTSEEYAGAQALAINSDTLAGIPDPYLPDYIHTGITSSSAQQVTPLDDFNATYYFMWDDQFFYAAVSVVDDSYSYVGPYPNGSDALQFVFAETPGEIQTSFMYIPTIAADNGAGDIDAKNDFDGWILSDIMGDCTYAAHVDETSQDWAVEIKIPWTAMQGDFDNDVFPPQAGDQAGFCILAIDYDEGALQWFGCIHESFPWQGLGIERINFIERETAVSNWSLY